MNKLHFLSGLPRSGSTVLAALLNQHPQLHATPTSELVDLLGAVVSSWENSPCVAAQALGLDAVYPVMKSIIDTRYRDVSKSVVLDKSRTWPEPQIMETIEKVLGYSAKIVATVRHVPDCAASFVRLIKPQDLKRFCHQSNPIQHLITSYALLAKGYAARPENFLFVEYEELLQTPQRQLNRITDFLELDRFWFDLENIEQESVKELDEIAWNIPGLHKIGSKLEKQHSSNAREVLGTLYERFVQEEFWDPNWVQPKGLVDRQLEAFLAGDFEKAEAIGLCANPDDDRAAFNMGWYEMRRGNLQKAMALIDRGRVERVFGEPPPSDQLQWTGREGLWGKKVLLNLEGGLGDQICNARFATDLSDRGATVVVSGSPEIAQIILKIPGVSCFVDQRFAGSVYHDYWVPAGSAVRPLGYEFKDINGAAFINKLRKISFNKPMRIGIRWAGSPNFAHENLRRLPADELFGLADIPGVEVYSLQRDDHVLPPPKIIQPRLETWDDTMEIVSNLDLVISSCTSVAHLSAAMGVPTWILPPKNSEYYLWAVPGETTAWYNSVRLFRQEVIRDWIAPLQKVRQELLKLLE